jgi:hypothetical protein
VKRSTNEVARAARCFVTSEIPPTPLLPDFPHTRFFPELALVTWRPQGVFDAEHAEKVLAFVEEAERQAERPFNRYTDLSGITEMRLRARHVFSIAERRLHVQLPVKSAFFSDRLLSFSFARMIEILMEDATIHVRAFRDREAAAEWLEVPLEILTAED